MQCYVWPDACIKSGMQQCSTHAPLAATDNRSHSATVAEQQGLFIVKALVHVCAVPYCAVLCQAASFRLSHEKVFTPLVTLSILIQQNPELASVKKSFPKVAEQLLESVSHTSDPYRRLPYLRCSSSIGSGVQVQQHSNIPSVV